MMIVSCLPITRKYGGIAFLSLVARMTLMIFSQWCRSVCGWTPWKNILLGDDWNSASYCGLVYLVQWQYQDQINIPNDKNRLQRNIVNPKRGRSYPAVLIGRLGVNREYQGTSSHVGRQLMAFIKTGSVTRTTRQDAVLSWWMHTMGKRFSGIMKETVSFHSIKQTW